MYAMQQLHSSVHNTPEHGPPQSPGLLAASVGMHNSRTNTPEYGPPQSSGLLAAPVTAQQDQFRTYGLPYPTAQDDFHRDLLEGDGRMTPGLGEPRLTQTHAASQFAESAQSVH